MTSRLLRRQAILSVHVFIPGVCDGEGELLQAAGGENCSDKEGESINCSNVKDSTELSCALTFQRRTY